MKSLSLLSISTLAVAGLTAVAVVASAGTADAAIPTAQPVDAIDTYNQDYAAVQAQAGQASLPAIGIGTAVGCVAGGVLGAGVGSIVSAGVMAASANRLNGECLAAKLPAFDCPWPQAVTQP
ncbi:hypothetical protein [Nocardia sp. NPDC020380]|uniref:hypothetical protein n=1 Tax=Nocardia sp. NPDC020380 TaxID=3364309 RepID=UPI0037AD11E7